MPSIRLETKTRGGKQGRLADYMTRLTSSSSMTAERIRDKVRASRMKGMWMGGCPPLGYEVKNRKPVENPADAAQNAFIKSFNGRQRDEILNETLFPSLTHARATLATWRTDYNTERPHSRLA